MELLITALLNWAQASPGSLLGTGVLGLAIIAAGWRLLAGPPQRQQPLPLLAQAAAGQQQQRQQQQQQPAQKPKPSTALLGLTPLARSVRSKLAGVKRVTISVPGVLLLEQHAEQLSDSATVRPEVVLIVKELVQAVDTYLMAHVADDIGQATVAGALEDCGLIGTGTGQVPLHRLLLCSTLGGKVSIVRHLESELHIDAQSDTIGELARFIPQLLFIVPPGSAQAAGLESSCLPTGSCASNVGRATGLEDFFELHTS